MKEIGEEFVSQLDKAKSLNKYLWKFIIFEAVIIVFLSVSFLSIKETVRVHVELPAKILTPNSPVVLAGITGANKIYYKLWADYLTNKIANFSPENITNNMNILIKTFYPSDYANQENKINELVSLIKENLILQKFSVTKSEIKSIKKENKLIKEAVLKINGIATQKEGKKQEIKKECHYLYKMKYVQGVLYVKNFTTNCF